MITPKFLACFKILIIVFNFCLLMGCEKINYGIMETKDTIKVTVGSCYYVSLDKMSIDIHKNKLRVRKGSFKKMIHVAQEPIEIISIVPVYKTAYKRSLTADPIPIATTRIINAYIITIRKTDAAGE